jgi:predicted ribosome quality control (RQC) complex YloA/Tae2 family protein
VSLSAEEVAALCAELAPMLRSRRVQKVHQADDHTLLVDLAGRWLLLSVHPRSSRLHALAARPVAPAQPTALAMQLRKELGGARLTSLVARPGDRVVELAFSNGRRLIGELFPGGGDLVLVDAADLVLGALRRRRGSHYQPRPTPPPRMRQPRFETSAAVEAHYERLMEGLRAEEEARRQAAERKRLTRLQANLEADLARAGAVETLRQWAALLLAHLHEVPRGATAVTLPDDFGGGPPVRVELHPALDARANAEQLYRRARKYQAARTRIEERLRAVRLALAQDVVAGRPPPQPRPRPRSRPAERLPFRSFTSAAGDEIRVGRSAGDNDALTFQHARGSDLWLHVRDAPGSHVVACLSPGRPLDQRTLLDAATLAVHFSALRDERQVDVQYTLRKHVRKARAPGAVYVSEERTVRVRLEPERLARLLGTAPSTSRNS